MPELFPPPGGPADTSSGSGPATRDADQGQGGYEISAITNVSPPKTGGANGDEWYYKNEHGVSSPLTLPELIRLVGSGVVYPETLVWTAEFAGWMPARTVPALRVAHIRDVPEEKEDGPPHRVSSSGLGFSIAGFVLGLLGILAASLAYLTSIVSPAAAKEQYILVLVQKVLVVAWGLASLLAVIFGTIGSVKSSRAAVMRRGFGLGLAGPGL